jgi:hypothetical protein
MGVISFFSAVWERNDKEPLGSVIAKIIAVLPKK